jgi:predicted TIM-barrel fold metal-dependent hydrolase
MSIIDSHAHIVSDRSPTGAPHTAEQLLTLMDDAGVERAVLVQYVAAHGFDNGYVLDTAERLPQRFVAVCALDPRDDASAEWLTNLVRNRGAAGLRLRSPDRGPSLDWLAGSRPLWRQAADLGIPVCVHLQQHHHVDGIPLLRGLVSEFPEVSVVLDHAGNPPWRPDTPGVGLSLVETLAAHERLVVKFATVNLNRLEAARVSPLVALGRLIAVFGSGRVMWGSDAPNTAGYYPDMVRRMDEQLSHLADEDRHNILGGTAVRVYPKLATREDLAHARLPVT